MTRSAPDLDRDAELRSYEEPNRLKCGIYRAVQQLSDEDREYILQKLGEDWKHTSISRWFKARDLNVSDDMVKRHRVDGCSCRRLGLLS